jgi:2-desacetyl-2-hydroxyethyl bacteriochlorophyllide A dehydrogenase
MQAVLFSQPETFSVERVDDPACAPDEVIVQIAQCGICGTDVHIYHNEYMSDFPLIPGHEFSGTVVEVGKNVRGVQVGERVAVDPNLYCGECDFCRNEQANHCANWQGIGVTRGGGFAQYVAAPAKACYRLPDGMSDAQASFIEPLACVVHALKRFRMGPADSVLLFGAGPMGVLLVQALRNNGAARVVVVDKQPDRLALAAQYGAVSVPAGPGLKDVLADLAPRGFHAVVDATGVPAVVEQAFQYLRPRGQYLQFGVTPRTATVRINPYDLFHNDWTIVGSFALCYTFLPAIDLLQYGVIDVAPLVSHTVPLAQFGEAFHAFEAGQTLKVHVRP